MLNLKKYIFLFVKKNIPLKSLYLVEQPDTLTRQEYKGKIYVKNIGKKLM
jgi:hypothetical protein